MLIAAKQEVPRAKNIENVLRKCDIGRTPTIQNRWERTERRSRGDDFSAIAGMHQQDGDSQQCDCDQKAPARSHATASLRSSNFSPRWNANSISRDTTKINQP